jgi:ascorbate-specific PTS system EIIC-type component UlaA
MLQGKEWWIRAVVGLVMLSYALVERNPQPVPNAVLYALVAFTALLVLPVKPTVESFANLVQVHPVMAVGAILVLLALTAVIPTLVSAATTTVAGDDRGGVSSAVLVGVVAAAGVAAMGYDSENAVASVLLGSVLIPLTVVANRAGRRVAKSEPLFPTTHAADDMGGVVTTCVGMLCVLFFLVARKNQTSTNQTISTTSSVSDDDFGSIAPI